MHWKVLVFVFIFCVCLLNAMDISQYPEITCGDVIEGDIAKYQRKTYKFLLHKVNNISFDSCDPLTSFKTELMIYGQYGDDYEPLASGETNHECVSHEGVRHGKVKKAIITDAIDEHKWYFLVVGSRARDYGHFHIRFLCESDYINSKSMFAFVSVFSDLIGYIFYFRLQMNIEWEDQKPEWPLLFGDDIDGDIHTCEQWDTYSQVSNVIGHFFSQWTLASNTLDITAFLQWGYH